MKQVGLTPIEASIIGGTMPFIGALVRPFVGAAADKLHAHKVVLMLCCVLSGLFYAGLLFVPHRAQGDPASQTYAVTLNCDHGSSSQYIEYCYREDEDQKCPDKLSVNSSEVYSSTDIGSQPRLNSTRNCHIRCNGAAHTSVASSGISEEMVFDVVTFDRGDSPRHGNSSQTCIRYHFDKPINYTVTTRGVHCQELPCTATCKHELQECASKRHEEQVFDATFWYSFIFSLGANVALSPICSLIDAMTYDYLGDDRGKWGKQRMWGTIGFAVFAVISGLSMDLFSESSSKNKDYTAAFVLYALLSFIAAVFVWFYQIYQISNELTCAKEVLRNLGAVLKRLRAISLLVLLFMFGFYTGLIETFLYWHLSTLGGTKVLFGLCMLVNCLPEIPIMFLAGRIIQTLGYVNMLYVTLIAYAVRLTVYSFITNPWTVLAVEPLHGIAYGLMYSAASSYVSIITPPGMHGVMQGLLAGVHFGLGEKQEYPRGSPVMIIVFEQLL